MVLIDLKNISKKILLGSPATINMGLDFINRNFLFDFVIIYI